MPHEIESMFYTEQTPWHGQGVRLDSPPTSEEAIRASGLDWEVALESVFLSRPEKHEVVDGFKAIARQDSGAVLGMVGTSWRPLQNRKAFEFFDPFVQAGSAEYNTAGSLKGGQRVWILARLKNGGSEIVKGDPVESYLLLSNGHDGRHAIDVRFTPIRVVCWNTLTMAIGDGKAPFLKVYHRGHLADTMDRVQEVVNLTSRTFAATFEQYRVLAHRKVENIEQYVTRVLVKDEEMAEGRKPWALPKIVELFESGRGQDNPRVRGTLWAAYNAVTEWVDHQRGMDESRLDQAWFGEGRRVKERALRVASDLAKAA